VEIGIIGLPKSGKTTVFNALTRGHAEAARFGGQNMKPNLGVAKVPDPRLDILTTMFKPKRTVQAEVSYIDIPGAPEGVGKTQGISGEYLNLLQRCDALLHVVRAFQDPSLPHVEGSVAPYRDVATMNLELAFSDLGILERRTRSLETSLKSAKAQERDRFRQEEELLTRLKQGLEKDVPIREQDLNADERRLLSGYQFLTGKPLLVLFNLGEEQLPQTQTMEEEMCKRLNRPGVQCTTMCAKLEAELSQMDKEEEEEFRRSLSAGESGAARMIRISYHLLGLISFLTAGEDEVRAWTIRKDTPAVKAAGQIHTDIERGFIRAEIIAYADLVRCGGLVEGRRQGVLRAEGRNYVVQDGDVINFLFNV